MNERKQVEPTAALRPPTAALIGAVAVAGAVIMAMAVFQWDHENLGLLATLAAFAVIAERFDIRLVRSSRLSVSTAPILAAGTLAGLPGIMVVALAAALADHAGRNKPHYKGVFNAGVLLVAGAAYVAVFETFPVGGDSREWPALLFPSLVGVTVNFAINSALVALVIALSSGERLVAVWNENFRSLPPHYVVMGVLAAIMASAYEMEGLTTLAVAFVPLAMARFLTKQDLEHFRILSNRERREPVAEVR